MEVTKKNFKDSLGAIEKAIEESDFLAIDGEFTGLNHAGVCHNAIFDTPEERYAKLVMGHSGDFLLIQFGVCAFSYSADTKRYTAKPFNFYIFPRPFSRAAPDIRFSCQSSSLDFLISQGFDFNKMIRDGISYLRPADESRFKAQLKKKHEMFGSPSFIAKSGGSQTHGSKGPIDIPPEHKEFIDNICKKVEKFVECGEEEELRLPAFNAFLRKLTYQSLETKFGSEIHLQTKTGENRERYIVVTKISGEADLKQLEENKHAQDMAEIDDAVGFTHVIKMISESGKLVVGHNMMLDVAHTINQFMYPLPQDYEEFKSMCKCVFPRVMDTKLLANTQPFKDRIDNSGLSALLYTTQCAPFNKPNVEISAEIGNRYQNSEFLHEAGYDAYITGQCFIALSNYLGQCATPPVDHIAPDSPLLQPFSDKIFMMRSLDIPYMDLTAPDLNPNRDHVFHVTFPQEWKMSDINQLFAQFGNIYTGWLDETSAYVSLNIKSMAPSVMKNLCKKSSVYRIMTYRDHKNQTQDQNSKYKWTPNKSQGQIQGQVTPNNSGDLGTIQGQGKGQVTPKNTCDLDPGQVEGQGSGERKGVKRSLATGDHDTENAGSSKKPKALNVNAPEFTPTSTPESTPEKEEQVKWPDNINSEGKKIVILQRPNNNEAYKQPYRNNKNYRKGPYRKRYNNNANRNARNARGDAKPEFLVKDEDFPPLIGGQ